MRKQSDRMLEIIHEARSVIFDYPRMDRKQEPRMVHVSSCHKDGFQVVMSFKNAVCRLGYFNDLETACRFADMATYRWREYRRTTYKYNFSESQARIDTADESENGGTLARHLLGRIQTILMEEGLLSHTKFIRKQPKEKKKQGNKSPITVHIAKLESRIAQLEEQMATLRLSHTELPPVYDDIEIPKTIITDSVSKQTLPDPITPPDAPKTIW